jgi:hypothetical protein
LISKRTLGGIILRKVSTKSTVFWSVKKEIDVRSRIGRRSKVFNDCVFSKY